MRATNRGRDSFGGKNIQYTRRIFGLWTRNLMRTTYLGHPDYRAVAFAERGSELPLHLRASQSMSDMEYTYTRLQHILEWKWKRAMSDQITRRSDSRCRCTPTDSYIRPRRPNKSLTNHPQLPNLPHQTTLPWPSIHPAPRFILAQLERQTYSNVSLRLHQSTTYQTMCA